MCASYLGSLLLKFLNGSFVNAPAFVDEMASGGGFARVHMSNDNYIDVGFFLPHLVLECGVADASERMGNRAAAATDRRLLQRNKGTIRGVAMSNRNTTQHSHTTPASLAAVGHGYYGWAPFNVKSELFICGGNSFFARQ